jgi:hypothetical protein
VPVRGNGSGRLALQRGIASCRHLHRGRSPITCPRHLFDATIGLLTLANASLNSDRSAHSRSSTIAESRGPAHNAAPGERQLAFDGCMVLWITGLPNKELKLTKPSQTESSQLNSVFGGHAVGRRG